MNATDLVTQIISNQIEIGFMQRDQELRQAISKATDQAIESATSKALKALEKATPKPAPDPTPPQPKTADQALMEAFAPFGSTTTPPPKAERTVDQSVDDVAQSLMDAFANY